ncbi:hypothetical protein PAMP_003329 [Pampus punctatissimus]
MKLLVPAFLLLALGYLVTAEVVDSFEKKCSQFFLMGKPPTELSGSHYRKICPEKTAGDCEFATLYDTNHKIPVYCAYLFQKQGRCKRRSTWDIDPQHPSFNRGQWNVAEAKVPECLTDHCLNRGFHGYIVTGGVPGNNAIKGGVNIPSYFWSGFCCVDNNKVTKFSGACYGVNDNSNYVEWTTIDGLDAKLEKEYKTVGFKVFSNNCANSPKLQDECKK